MIRDQKRDLSAVHVINETVTSGGGAATVSDIDLLGFDAATIIADFGANGGDTLNGTNYFTVDLQHSDDGVSYTDVESADIVGDDTITDGEVVTVDDAAEDEAVYRVGYIGGKRYLDVTVTPHGTLANGNPVSIVLIKGLPHDAPVAD